MKKLSERLALLGLMLLMILSSTGCAETSKMALSIDTVKITDHMYSYWLCSAKSEFLRLYNNGKDSADFWNDTLSDGQTVEAYAQSLLLARVKNYAIAAKLFKDYGLKISSEISDEINQDIDEKIEYYDGREGLNTYLAEMDINIDILHDIYIMEEKSSALYDYLYGENGVEAITAQQLSDYFESNYSRINYIVIYTEGTYRRDEDGNLVSGDDGTYLTRTFTAEEKAAQQAKVDRIYAEIQGGASFDEAKQAYDEYPFDVSYYQNGFYVSEKELDVYGSAMVNGVAGMEVGEIKVVYDTSCAYIIRKEALPSYDSLEACDKELLDGLEDDCTAEAYAAKLAQYADSVTVDSEIIAQYSFEDAYPNSLI